MAASARKLLIVDDEPATRNTLSQIFGMMGHSVECAEDGFSALRKIRENKPDVIVSDLNMPGMSGFELLSVVRRRLPSIYVIATSGAYSGEKVPRGIAADAFYEKATNIKTLLRLLNAADELQQSSERIETEQPPVWISQSEDLSADGVPLMVHCQECLRSSIPVCAASPWVIHETECIYCGAPMRYAIIKTMDAVTSMANQPGLIPVPASAHSAKETA